MSWHPKDPELRASGWSKIPARVDAPADDDDEEVA